MPRRLALALALCLPACGKADSPPAADPAATQAAPTQSAPTPTDPRDPKVVCEAAVANMVTLAKASSDPAVRGLAGKEAQEEIRSLCLRDYATVPEGFECMRDAKSFEALFACGRTSAPTPPASGRLDPNDLPKCKAMLASFEACVREAPEDRRAELRATTDALRQSLTFLDEKTAIDTCTQGNINASKSTARFCPKVVWEGATAPPPDANPTPS